MIFLTGAWHRGHPASARVLASPPRPERRRRKAWPLALVLLAVLAGAAPAFAEPTASDFSAGEDGWQGLSEFVRLAGEVVGKEHLRVVARVDYGALGPTDALIVLHPEVELDARSLTAFLAAGGRLALLDDFGRGAAFLRTFGIDRTPAPPGVRFSLRGDPDLAIATPYEETVAGARVGRHPMLEGVEQVVTNHPQVLEHPDLTPVLGIEKNDGALSPILVTGVIAGRGRLVAGSDPSIFINLMLRYPGNRRLVSGLVRYLTARETSGAPSLGGSGGASRIYVVSGRFEQAGSYGNSQDGVPPWRARLKELAEKVREAFASGVPDVAWLLAAALLASLVVGREIVKLRLKPAFEQPRYARALPLLAQAGPWARAEVLAAPTTTPLLALVELEAALSETLSHRLGIGAGTSTRELQKELREAGLDAPTAARVVSLLEELRTLGQSLAARSPKRPSGARLKRLKGEGMHLLRALERLGHKV